MQLTRSWNPITSTYGKQIWKKEDQWQVFFSWAPKSLWYGTAATKLKNTCPLKENLWQTSTAYEKAETLLCWQRSSYRFSSNYVQMWELDHKEGWVLNNWSFFELLCWRRLLRVPWIAISHQLILKEINPDVKCCGLLRDRNLVVRGRW